MKVLCLGETLLRYSTKKGHRFTELAFDVHIGGSETNIAVNLSQLGFNTKLITKLPKHELGSSVISFLNSFKVDTSSIIRNDMRIGSYFLEVGSGNRTSQVIYDRSHSAMTSFSLEDIDMEEVFKDIDAFVVSGITVALNKTVEDTVLKMLEHCKKNNIKVVYDSNYRSKLWSIEEASVAFRKILPYVDILSAGYLDATNFLGLISEHEGFNDKLEDLYRQMKEEFPNIKYITSTKRNIISNSVNDLTGYLYSDRLYVSNTYHIDDIIDRVGGGDAYISGIIYGLLNNMDLNRTLSFGCCSSVLKHTIYGDANLFSVDDIEKYMYQGVSRINR